MKCAIGLLAVCALAAACMPAMAQESTITLHTDKKLYILDEDMVVWGSVSTVLPGEQMQMKVLYGDDVVMVDQFGVASDGTFARFVNTGGPNWREGGTYVVRVWYGSDNTSQDFTYAAEDASVMRMIEVTDGRGGTFDLEYGIRGGTIQQMAVNYDSLAIVVDLNSDDGGSLTLDLPRQYINATEAGEDTSFIVMSGSQMLHHVEHDSDPDVRRIEVAFPSGTSQITVVGTAVVPEFGAAAALLLVTGGAAAISRFRSTTTGISCPGWQVTGGAAAISRFRSRIFPGMGRLP